MEIDQIKHVDLCLIKTRKNWMKRVTKMEMEIHEENWLCRRSSLEGTWPFEACSTWSREKETSTVVFFTRANSRIMAMTNAMSIVLSRTRDQKKRRKKSSSPGRRCRTLTQCCRGPQINCASSSASQFLVSSPRSPALSLSLSLPCVSARRNKRTSVRVFCLSSLG